MKKQKTYLHEKHCKNCGGIINLEIPFGKTVEDYLKENPKCFKCPICGCYGEVSKVLYVDVKEDKHEN